MNTYTTPTPAERDLHDFPYGHGGQPCPFGHDHTRTYSAGVRCRHGFGQNWACHQTASVEVIYTYGAHEALCAYHAKRAARVATSLPLE